MKMTHLSAVLLGLCLAGAVLISGCIQAPAQPSGASPDSNTATPTSAPSAAGAVPTSAATAPGVASAIPTPLASADAASPTVEEASASPEATEEPSPSETPSTTPSPSPTPAAAGGPGQVHYYSKTLRAGFEQVVTANFSGVAVKESSDYGEAHYSFAGGVLDWSFYEKTDSPPQDECGYAAIKEGSGSAQVGKADSLDNYILTSDGNPYFISLLKRVDISVHNERTNPGQNCVPVPEPEVEQDPVSVAISANTTSGNRLVSPPGGSHTPPDTVAQGVTLDDLYSWDIPLPG